MANNKPKQKNSNSKGNDIPLSEDLLFNYISGITDGSTPQVNTTSQTQPTKTKQQAPSQNQNNINLNKTQSTSHSPNTTSTTNTVQKAQSTNPEDTPEIAKIRAQLQEEIQKKKTGTSNQIVSPPLSQTQISPQASKDNIISVSNNVNLPPQATAVVQDNTPAPNISSTTQQVPSPQINRTIPAEEISMPVLLEEVIRRNASDLHLAVGYPPLIRIDGALITYGNQPLTASQLEKLVYSILSPEKRDILEVNKEVDFGYGYKDLGRFRVNAYHSKGYLAAALRLIPNRIRSIEELHLPKMYHQLADLEQGFVLVTGPTGHGKSTTLAAIIQEINVKYPKHILTIEDPIEYVFPPAKALVTQRELGEDTNSWKIALRSALREDPDVVLIGEMRDYETIDAAINIAETGHLVFSTLHTNSASQTIDRIISVFPAEQQNKVRSQLAEVIKVIISQRLIPLKGGGRIPVSEVMIINSAIKNLIREGKIYQIDNVIRTGAEQGMISLERSLVDLVKQKLITLEEARKYAWSPDEVNRLISMAY